MNRIAFASILLSALLTCCAVCLFWLHQDISALDTALSQSESLTAQQDYDAAIAVLKEATVVGEKDSGFIPDCCAIRNWKILP